MSKTIQINLRLPSEDKRYYTKQLREFAERFNDEIKGIAFGKQDTRGNNCITLYDADESPLTQLHFASSKELLVYVEGFNAAKNDWDLSRFID